MLRAAVALRIYSLDLILVSLYFTEYEEQVY